MAELASLPASVVFSSLNLGAAIVAYTPHAATSAGYHRNADAFWNGFGPYEDRLALRDALASSRADYLMVCVGTGEERIVSPSVMGELPPWLTEVTGDRRSVRVFLVDKPALLQATDSP